MKKSVIVLLSGNGIGMDEMRILIQSLKSNTILLELDLSRADNKTINEGFFF